MVVEVGGVMMAGGAVDVKDDPSSEPLSAPAMATRWGRAGTRVAPSAPRVSPGEVRGDPGRWLWMAPGDGLLLGGWGRSATGEREGRFFPEFGCRGPIGGAGSGGARLGG